MKKKYLFIIMFLNFMVTHQDCNGKSLRQRLQIPQPSSLHKPTWMKRPQSIRSFVPTKKGVQQKWTSLKTSKRLDPVKKQWTAFKTSARLDPFKSKWTTFKQSKPVQAVGSRWQTTKQDYLSKIPTPWRKKQVVPKEKKMLPSSQPPVQQMQLSGPASIPSAKTQTSAPPVPTGSQPPQVTIQTQGLPTALSQGITGFKKDALKKTETVVKGTGVTGNIIDTPTLTTPVKKTVSVPVATAAISGVTAAIPATGVPLTEKPLDPKTYLDAAPQGADVAYMGTTDDQRKIGKIKQIGVGTGGDPRFKEYINIKEASQKTPVATAPSMQVPLPPAGGPPPAPTGGIPATKAVQPQSESPINLQQALLKRRGNLVSKEQLQEETKNKKPGGLVVTTPPKQPQTSQPAKPTPQALQSAPKPGQALLQEITGGNFKLKKTPTIDKSTLEYKKQQEERVGIFSGSPLFQNIEKNKG